MSRFAGVGGPAARDELLAQLLGELTEQLRAGEPADVESLAQRHPDLGDELRELWAAAQMAEAFAGHGSRSRVTIDAPEQKPRPAAGSLPRRFGDYELLEELGRGGMGVVYKARQRHPDRVVAIKMIL